MSEFREIDVCVVGAGIVGLAHALEARRRGLSVLVLDRDARAVGASVRNFGHVFVGGQGDGASFEYALRSRERWLELAAQAGVTQAGSVVIARAEDELAVLEQTAQDPAREMRMLTAEQVRELVPVNPDGLLGGLHSGLDLRVNPRDAVAALAALLGDDAILWNTRVDAVEPGLVHAGDQTLAAEQVIVCPGPDYRELPAELRAGSEELTRCALQMLRVAAPHGRRYDPAIATGLSLIRYPGFAERPAAAALRARLQRERPEYLAAGIHLLITQLPDGDLIIGDSHTYGETLDCFRREDLDSALLAEAAALLGVADLEVRERWQGIYTSIPEGDEPFHVSAPMPGVRVVQNVVGLGMTLSLGFAETVLEELLSAA
ncbi:MAG: TIGR03364 family FAD-dependent oxidoreductase [Solirubrobacterales bacterium]|nr:TIGR03364 family FAD-dependent oxidoreductase [Solirubrobacterales bacterium]